MKRSEKKMIQRLEKMSKRFDALYDPYSSRGGTLDRTQRLRGRSVSRNWSEHLELYKSNGFIQTIIDSPANDATREWITIKTNRDDANVSRMIQNRMDELKIKEKIYDLIKYSRMYSKGAWLYYGIISQAPQEERLLGEPMPEILKIDYINVIDNPDHVNIFDVNISEPLKKDYGSITFSIQGVPVHRSRLSWLVNSYIPQDKLGVSVIDRIFDGISAQDSALWSTSSLVQDLATKVFKSDLIANMSPEARAEILSKMKHMMVTLSTLALTSDEDFQKMTYNVTGIREVYDFIIDNLAGLSEIPKNILVGKSHGVVTAGEYDTLNYYAKVKQFQENKLRPIIDKIVKMIISERQGSIYSALGGDTATLDWEYDFNSLWELDPLSQADIDIKKSQRDEIDFNIGKANAAELRSLDERYAELETPEALAMQELDKAINEI